MPAICAAAAAAVAVAIAAAAATLAPPILPPAHAEGPEPGTLAFQFGSLGRGPGEFQNIVSIAVGPDGKIYVADDRRIQMFHPNGTYGSLISDYIPRRMAVDPDGKIYTSGYGGVGFVNPNGTRSVLAYVGNAWGLAVDPDGKIYVFDGDHYKVTVFHPNGTSVLAFGELGDDDGEFSSRYVEIAVGPDGKIYVADGRIQAFHPNGTFAFRFGDGRSITFGPSGEFVVDWAFYYPNGTLVSEMAYWPGAVAFGPTGLFVNGYDNRVRVFYGVEPTDEWQPSSLYEPPSDRGGGSGYMPPAAPSGPPVAGSRFAFEIGSYGSGPGEFRWPDNVAFGPGGIIAVSDWGNNRVNVFHPNGTFAYAFGSSGHGPGEFNRPFGIAFGPNGLLAVTDVGNHRVQFFYLE